MNPNGFPRLKPEDVKDARYGFRRFRPGDTLIDDHGIEWLVERDIELHGFMISRDPRFEWPTIDRRVSLLMATAAERRTRDSQPADARRSVQQVAPPSGPSAGSKRTGRRRSSDRKPTPGRPAASKPAGVSGVTGGKGSRSGKASSSLPAKAPVRKPQIKRAKPL
jgi:hypothetical protein